MDKSYKLGKLMQELSEIYKVKLNDSSREELSKEPYLELSERCALQCDLQQKSPIITSGTKVGMKLLYFGVMEGKYELDDVVEQTSIIKYYPSEFGFIINPNNVVRLARYNNQLDLKIRDRKIEKSLKKINGYPEIITSLHRDFYSSEFQNLEQK